jgi:hypothetical protein
MTGRLPKLPGSADSATRNSSVIHPICELSILCKIVIPKTKSGYSSKIVSAIIKFMLIYLFY